MESIKIKAVTMGQFGPEYTDVYYTHCKSAEIDSSGRLLVKGENNDIRVCYAAGHWVSFEVLSDNI